MSGPRLFVLPAMVVWLTGCGAAGRTEVTLSPTRYESWEWSRASLTSGALADVQAADGQCMVWASDPKTCNSSAVYWFDTPYHPAQVARITFDCRLRASRTDTPRYHIMVKPAEGERWSEVASGAGTGANQDYTWQTGDADGFMSAEGRLGMEVCGCRTAGNSNAYTTAVDLVRVRLDLHTAPPDPPGGLTAEVRTGPEVRLTWTDASGNEYRFRLQRKAGQGVWAEVAQLPAQATQYADLRVTARTTYRYRLCAYNAVGESAWTQEAVAAVPAPGPPAAPSGLSAVARSRSEIDLCWSDNARDEESFVVEVATKPAGPFRALATVPRDLTRCFHTGLTAGQTYTYRVRAGNARGLSVPTPAVSAAPRDRPVVVVSSLAALRDAIAAAAPGTTLELTDGVYPLDVNGIHIDDKSDLVIRSQSRRREAVVIKGKGLNDYPEFCFKLYRSQHIVLEDMTLRDVYWHCVQVNEGSSDVIFRNLYMWDAGEGPIKTTISFAAAGKANQDGPFCDNGLVEDCVIGYTNGSTRGAIEGADLMGSANWVFRRVQVYNCYGDPYYTNSPGYGIFAKGGSLDTTIDSCYFQDCGIAISFGGGGSPDDWKRGRSLAEHTGGMMCNNVVRRTERVIPINDVAVYMNKAADYRLYHNTFWTTSAGSTSIDIRFVQSRGWIANNLCRQGLGLRDGGKAVESGNVWNAPEDVFVDAAKGDFHLRPAAARALAKGTDTGGWVTRDRDGRPRPARAPTPGAYEPGR